jgi:hypothetical protein
VRRTGVAQGRVRRTGVAQGRVRRTGVVQVGCGVAQLAGPSSILGSALQGDLSH